MAKEKPVTYPKTLGACVDLLYQRRAERLEAQSKVDSMKEKEDLLKDHILNNFGKDDIEGAKGKLATCTVTRRTTATVTDWTKLYEYIKKTGSFDLLQRRISDTAYRARLDENEVVPGCEPFIVVNLSVTKSNKKEE